MPARLRIHVPDGATLQRVLADRGEVVLGRADDCDVPIAHDSVSRRHVSLAHGDDGWVVRDLGSKNGLRVERVRVERHVLGRGGWFALGDVYCEVEALDAAANAALGLREAERRAASQEWTARVTRAAGSDSIFASVLAAIVEIADCRRGFLLGLGGDGELRVRARHALEPAALARADFSGSRGAVERAIRERRAVILSRAHDHAWLDSRASAVARGLRLVVALPLLHDGRLLGVAYADSDDDGALLTDLDAEILNAFADRAATALAASELDATLAGMERRLALDAVAVTAPPDWQAIARAAAQAPAARGPGVS